MVLGFQAPRNAYCRYAAGAGVPLSCHDWPASPTIEALLHTKAAWANTGDERFGMSDEGPAGTPNDLC